MNKQKLELEHLKLQIRPHFYLNSLNIIYRLAQKQEHKLIKEMALCLMEYFRYILRNNLTFVSLAEELRHVRNYLRIQEMQYAGGFTYEIDVPDFLLDSPVPPLIIQVFVENSIKHAVTLDEPIRIFITANYEKINGKEFLKILVRDTGKGFPDEVLQRFHEGVYYENGVQKHIGIQNTQRRLQLLYKGEASISLSNDIQSGAVVEVDLPLGYHSLN